MYILDKRTLIRCISFGAALIFALPFNFGRLTGLSNWFSPFLMLSSVFVIKSFVIFNLIGLVVLLFTWFKTRWFCRYLCPVGLSLDIVRKCFQTKNNISISKIPNINKWLAVISLGGAILGFSIFLFLDPIIIFNGFFVLLIPPFNSIVLLTLIAFPLLMITETVLPGLWCEKLCPTGGLQLSISELKNSIYKSSSKTNGNDLGRRLFLGGTMGLLAALVLPDFAKNKMVRAVRPPGSIGTNYFNALCIRCGSCIKVCPTQILEHETSPGISFLTPVIRFNSGYCLENCNSCGEVCPSGVITHFSIDQKKTFKIGYAIANLDSCLLMSQKECAVCKQACHYGAIKIVEVDNNSIKMKPAFNDLNCIGCGACVIICPENCIKIQAI